MISESSNETGLYTRTTCSFYAPPRTSFIPFQNCIIRFVRARYLSARLIYANREKRISTTWTSENLKNFREMLEQIIAKGRMRYQFVPQLLRSPLFHGETRHVVLLTCVQTIPWWSGVSKFPDRFLHMLPKTH